MILAPHWESPIPQQVGPPTQYAREKRPILMGILAIQVALTITHCVFALNIFGAIIMGLQVFVGYCAWHQDMNITYLTYFGIICCINGIFATVMAILAILLDVIFLSFGAIISACFLPLSDAAGAYLAYLVYKDWDQAQKIVASGMLGSLGSLGSFGAPAGMLGLGGMFGHASAAEAQPFAGKGYTLGSADAFMNQGKAYGEQGLASAQGGWASAQAAAPGYLSSAEASAAGYLSGAQAGAGGYLSGAQAGPGGYLGGAQATAGGFLSDMQDSLFSTAPSAKRPVPQGHHDVMFDPFITR